MKYHYIHQWLQCKTQHWASYWCNCRKAGCPGCSVRAGEPGVGSQAFSKGSGFASMGWSHCPQMRWAEHIQRWEPGLAENPDPQMSLWRRGKSKEKKTETEATESGSDLVTVTCINHNPEIIRQIHRDETVSWVKLSSRKSCNKLQVSFS